MSEIDSTILSMKTDLLTNLCDFFEVFDLVDQEILRKKCKILQKIQPKNPQKKTVKKNA